MSSFSKRMINFFKDPMKLIIYMSRFRIFRLLPDDKYQKLLFRAKMKYKLNLDNPSTFNEKLQWLKIYDRKPEYNTMVDKFEAKKFVADIVGKEHIVENYGCWNSFDEIDFSKLPKQFVLKCTHDCGGLVICRDKDKLDKDKAREKIEKSLKRNYYWTQREWPYKDVKPRIIAEKYLENAADKDGLVGLVDYKFFCFNGKPEMLYVSKGLENHDTAKISFYDLDGKEMPFRRSDYAPVGDYTLPENFSEMKLIAAKIAQSVDCPFVRIDLYSVEDNIYFSEITFTPCGGMIPFEPSSADIEVGKWLTVK